jgi:inner membrane protein
MFVLGHIGISLGAGLVANHLMRAQAVEKPFDTGQDAREAKASSGGRFAVATGLDLRFVLLGSLMPDIIDKPLGIFVFGDTLSNGRIYGHTLLFLLVLAGAGFWLWRYRRGGWLMAIACGVLMHLILDQIWIEPETLFWPLLGFSFGRLNVENWVGEVFFSLFHDPYTFIPEITGIIIVASFILLLIRRGRITDFLAGGLYLPHKNTNFLD